MGRGATLSILGLYNYDNTIFDLLDIPSEYFTHENTVNQILMDCAELEILYPDPETMKEAIGIWSAGNQYAFQHLEKMILAEYSPIENTDRYEESTDTSTPNFTNTETLSDISSATGWNSDAFKNTGKTTGSRSVFSAGTGTLSHTAHIHGNIGITTNQEMIEAEKQMILAGYNFYEIVADMFKRKFCIRVY